MVLAFLEALSGSAAEQPEGIAGGEQQRAAMFRLISRLLCPVLEQIDLQPRLRASLLTIRDADGDSLLVCATRAGADAIVRSLLTLSARQSLLRAIGHQRTASDGGSSEAPTAAPPPKRPSSGLNGRAMLFSSSTGKWALQIAIESLLTPSHAFSRLLTPSPPLPGKWALQIAIESGPSPQHYECVQLLLAYRGPHAPLPFDQAWAPRGSLPESDEPWAESVRQLCSLVRGDVEGDAEGRANAGIVRSGERGYVINGRCDLSEGGASMVRLARVSSRRSDDDLNGRQVGLSSHLPTWRDQTRPQLTSSQLTLPHLTSSHLTSPRLTRLNFVTLT